MIDIPRQIEEGIVGQVHVGDVGIDRRHLEVLLVEICVHPPETIVLIDEADLLLEVFSPHRLVTVGPRAPVLLASPRIADLNQLRTVAQLLRVVDREGVSVWHSNAVRILVGARACVAGRGDHPAFVPLSVDVVP